MKTRGKLLSATQRNRFEFENSKKVRDQMFEHRGKPKNTEIYDVVSTYSE